jgi:phosphoribosylaminoimidazole carboxylase PurE protein
MMSSKKIQVVVVMGSKSDLPVMKSATELLREFEVGCRIEIVSAHRTPDLLQVSAKKWESEGVSVIIAGAGGAAHLPGMLASFSVLPVIGVPVKSSSMNGLDALLSVAQMPKGVPVATVAVNNSYNAALLAIKILAATDTVDGMLRVKLSKYKTKMAKNVSRDRKKLGKLGVNQFLKQS